MVGYLQHVLQICAEAPGEPRVSSMALGLAQDVGYNFQQPQACGLEARYMQCHAT